MTGTQHNRRFQIPDDEATIKHASQAQCLGNWRVLLARALALALVGGVSTGSSPESPAIWNIAQTTLEQEQATNDTMKVTLGSQSEDGWGESVLRLR